MQPRRWFACARLSAATSALDSVGSGGTSDDAGEHARPQSAIALVAGRRLSATLKQSSSALHRSGCDAAAAAGAQAATAGCALTQARLRRPWAQHDGSPPEQANGGGSDGDEDEDEDEELLSSVNATCSGVSCACPRRRASASASLSTAAASADSAWCTVYPPARIAFTPNVVLHPRYAHSGVCSGKSHQFTFGFRDLSLSTLQKRYR
ncbi:Os02g0465000 [Oryza sativa Japonica Group]|uniref:Os02g0465000 protein n=1 Tax=Oryza sativa subsp. japonica TaxID=39947 RepID=Q0E1B6_ORYSJ|nr:Os02g0465000 [Oryza sativa Japonica Group]|eukprot:NP_001046808.2 Os02g0465000 [Oryza sativa Japonica Group]